MRIVKPYGRSTTRGSGPTLRRGLETSRRTRARGAEPWPDIAAFAEHWPELVIAQWISAIDKIATKPKAAAGATDQQRALRAKLGAACWNRLTQVHCGMLGRLDAARLEVLAKHWERKIHPYRDKRNPQRFNKKGDRVPLPDPRGRWYTPFCGDATHETVDAAAVAEAIERHLTQDAIRLSGGTRRSQARDTTPRGLIALRAESIEKNVLKARLPPSPAPDEMASWVDADVAAYTAVGDPAATIHAAAAEQETKNRRVTSSLAARVLYEHYGRVFVADGNVLGREDAAARMPGCYALHQSVRKAYVRLLKRHARKSVLRVLPRDLRALLKLIDRHAANRDLNALVRLGRVIHHEAGNKGGADSVADIVTGWPDDVSASRFWTSDGQTEIKRTEAFVRAWRTAIAHGARTLNDWVDPDRVAKGRSGGPSDMLLADFKDAPGTLDITAALEKARLLFGNRAKELAGDDPSDLMRLVQSGLARLRNAAFHFRGMGAFVYEMSSIASVKSGVKAESGAQTVSPVLPAAIDLWTADQADRMDRVKDTLRAAHAERYLEQGQLAEIWSRAGPTASALALPRFNRVVTRSDDAWNGDARLGLPKAATADQLKEWPARRCQYVLLKLLYERGFRDWLASRSADELNGWIDRAANHTTEEAKKLMKLRRDAEKRRKEKDERVTLTVTDDDIELATAKADGLIRLEPRDTYRQFFYQLSALTATEFRVQDGYSHDASKAREQAKFLENLQCDVVAIAFDAYLSSNRLDWICRMRHDARPSDEPQCSGEELASYRGKPPNDWQAVLYLVVHLIPVDEVGRLLHRLNWWSTGFRELPSEVELLSDVFALYLDMHDAKFQGVAAIAEHKGLAGFFESADLRDRVLPALLGSDADQTSRVPRRGLRELLRFGDLASLAPILEDQKVTAEQVDELDKLEKGIVAAQSDRRELHKKLQKGIKLASKDDLIKYCNALSIVIRHRRLAHHVNLVNHVRLHQIVMRVLGRLLDYAGLWERDLYFVMLALMYDGKGKSPADYLSVEPTGRNGTAPLDLLRRGRIIKAIRNLNDRDLTRELKDRFGENFLNSTSGTVAVRNRLAHFNMLWEAASKDPKRHRSLNLTKEIARTRCLMAYDRKLQNAVTKSIIGLLERENIGLSWSFRRHMICNAKLYSFQVKHIKHSSLTENLHDMVFLKMVGSLFKHSFVEEKGELIDVPDIRDLVDQIFSEGAERDASARADPSKGLRRIGSNTRAIPNASTTRPEVLLGATDSGRAKRSLRPQRRQHAKAVRTSDREGHSDENPFFTIDPNKEGPIE